MHLLCHGHVPRGAAVGGARGAAVLLLLLVLLSLAVVLAAGLELRGRTGLLERVAEGGEELRPAGLHARRALVVRVHAAAQKDDGRNGLDAKVLRDLVAVVNVHAEEARRRRLHGEHAEDGAELMAVAAPARVEEDDGERRAALVLEPADWARAVALR